MNTNKTTVNDLIEESVKFANTIKSSANKAALNTFSQLIAEEVKQNLTESDEPFPTEPDQPSGYDAEGGQKRIEGTGDRVDDKGAGPDIIEGDVPDEGGATMGKEDDAVKADNAKKSIAEMDDLNLDLPGEEGEEGEKDMNMESASLSVESDDNDEDDKKDMKEGDEKDEKKDDKVVKENKMLKKAIATLKTENAQLKKGVVTLRKALQETALINAKMDYVSKVSAQFPTLSANTKKKVFENIDKAKSLAQAKSIYETVTSVIKENLKKTPNKTVSERAKQIVESAQKNKKSVEQNSLNENYNYMTKLAGID